MPSNHRTWATVAWMLPFALAFKIFARCVPPVHAWSAALAAWLFCAVAFVGHAHLRKASRKGVAVPRVLAEIFGGMAIGSCVGVMDCLLPVLGFGWSVGAGVVVMALAAALSLLIEPRSGGAEPCPPAGERA